MRAGASVHAFRVCARAYVYDMRFFVYVRIFVYVHICMGDGCMVSIVCCEWCVVSIVCCEWCVVSVVSGVW